MLESVSEGSRHNEHCRISLLPERTQFLWEELLIDFLVRPLGLVALDRYERPRLAAKHGRSRRDVGLDFGTAVNFCNTRV
jgi:hypothetical protein